MLHYLCSNYRSKLEEAQNENPDFVKRLQQILDEAGEAPRRVH